MRLPFDELVGKTITNVNQLGINALQLDFSDGTSVVVSEAAMFLGVPELALFPLEDF